MNHSKKFLKLGIAALLATTPLFATASPADQDDRAFSGTIACGGSHFNRVGGTEAQRTAYVLRNYNDSLSININRLAVYDATGAILADFNGATLPIAFNGVFGGGDNSIEPFQTALYLSADLIGAPLPNALRPISVRIDWSADAKALIPEISYVRNARRLDQSSREQARATSSCRSIVINKGKGNNKDKDDD